MPLPVSDDTIVVSEVLETSPLWKTELQGGSVKPAQAAIAIVEIDLQNRPRPGSFVKQEETGISIRVPVYIQIQHEIRRGIQAGDYAAGDRIPSENELAERFETTRATVARALQELVFDGTIVRRAGAGSFVASGAAAGRR